MTQENTSSDVGHIRLSLQLQVVQDVLRRYRRNFRVRVLTAAAGLLALVASAAVFYFVSEPYRSLIGAPLIVVGLLLGVVAVAASRISIASRVEREFLGIADDLSIRDFELLGQQLRARRRGLPEGETETYRTAYQDDITFYVDDLRQRGVRSRRANNLVQVVTIVGSLAATALGSLAIANGLFQWASPAITFVVGTASGVAAIYKFKDRSFYSQQTANSIEQELAAFQLGIGRYVSEDEASRSKARTTLVEELHRLRTEQENREQNLDQPVQRGSEGD